MIIEVVYLNAGPPSVVSPAETNADINAILATWNPNFLLGTEATGDGSLPRRRPKYPGKVRDTTPVNKANLFGYFDRKFEAEWKIMKLDFPRRPGKKGNIPARALFKGNYEGAQVIDGHHPPGWRGTDAARAEYRKALKRTMAPWTRDDWLEEWDTPEKRAAAKARPRLLGWDCNMTNAEVRAFAREVGGEVVGGNIDCFVVRHMKVLSWEYTRMVGRHELHTDHPWGCLRAKLRFEGG